MCLSGFAVKLTVVMYTELSSASFFSVVWKNFYHVEATFPLKYLEALSGETIWGSLCGKAFINGFSFFIR